MKTLGNVLRGLLGSLFDPRFFTLMIIGAAGNVVVVAVVRPTGIPSLVFGVLLGLIIGISFCGIVVWVVNRPTE